MSDRVIDRESRSMRADCPPWDIEEEARQVSKSRLDLVVGGRLTVVWARIMPKRRTAILLLVGVAAVGLFPDEVLALLEIFSE